MKVMGTSLDEAFDDIGGPVVFSDEEWSSVEKGDFVVNINRTHCLILAIHDRGPHRMTLRVLVPSGFATTVFLYRNSDRWSVVKRESS